MQKSMSHTYAAAHFYEVVVLESRTVLVIQPHTLNPDSQTLNPPHVEHGPFIKSQLT